MRLKASVVRFATVMVLILSLAVVFRFFSQEATVLCGRLTLMSAKSYFPLTGEAIYPNVKNEAVTEASQSKLIEQTTQTKASVKAEDDLSKVDADIEKLIKNAEKNSSKDKKDGAITEYTFTNDGVTDSFENVKVKNTNETKINIQKKLSEKLELKVSKKEPAVLIYHTHTTETYQLLDRDFYAQGFLSRSNNENLNMVRVGKAIAAEIEKQGYKVIHDTSVYDNPYSGAYYRSEDAAKALLEKYPSIQITLDIHRDAIQNDKGVKTKPVAEINGKKAAQVMIITGCQEKGNGITDLPEWEKNLTFALKLQKSIENSFPGLARPVFFCARSYNMGLTPCSLLVEVGTDANTLDEAVYSGKMLGRALSDILKNHEES